MLNWLNVYVPYDKYRSKEDNSGKRLVHKIASRMPNDIALLGGTWEACPFVDENLFSSRVMAMNSKGT